MSGGGAQDAAAPPPDHVEPEPGKEPISDAAKGLLAWNSFRSSRGYTAETVVMLMHEFIARRALFADLMEFVKKGRFL